MSTAPLTESLHGVLMNIAGTGVLIIGSPGSGKSSLSLELLHHGHQLIADDIVDFSLQRNNHVIGSCPEMLFGFLHTKELGILNITSLFGQQALARSATLGAIIQLDNSQKNNNPLQANTQHKQVCSLSFPCLTLSTNNPASLYHRLQVWLKLLTDEKSAAEQLKARQQKMMNTRTG